MSTPIIITRTSSSKTSEIITKNTRDPSFSSFLDGAEETFVLKLGGGGATQDHNFVGKKKSDDREIDVFDAEKYFNEGLTNHATPKAVGAKILSKKDEPVEIFAGKEKGTKSNGTLSLRSESSSNSRSTLLLQTNSKKQHHLKKPANYKKGFLATIGCNCSCTDKNSVVIENGKSRQENHKTRDHLVRKSLSEYTCVRFEESELRVSSEGHFSFPVFNSKNGKPQDNGKKKKNNNNNSCLSLEEKLTMMNWDADQETKIPQISRTDNDSDSDASSDLFEIESLSKGNSSYLSRQASDGLSCVTPTNCYAPSEASIEWSVVTASAADFSAISDSEELKYSNSKTGSKEVVPKVVRPSILSGCKSDKAVGVVGDAHNNNNNNNNRSNEQLGNISNSRRHLVGESLIQPLTRFHEEIKVAGFDSRIRRQSFDARVLSRPGTAAAHLLYT
ncbi:hypothetical protein ABFS82_12G103000 [Erythranthe guttata]|uniref:Protein PHYTOCHROME KINASE SUBSTRATE 1 n=1 Tax=Erythranthe guttata TaxID=4155 RepID=A0A022QN72_ERYGU|nr:PREDICTED: protein PHYTOCHROME KINASE SUBSTRATE 2-like [Erythranthe guttata]EYU28743.1 hypothetical protein MIMGU_mgv1a006398mg [Erythranthe guttata]|eukprot:XP_012847788.1 PREDICTED: protein PHYTOCHROME KINASE SUBSTRATE 2-like [Erythranthe guttata]